MPRRALPKHVAERLGGAESLREAELVGRIQRAGLPAHLLQHRIIPTRRFRWDICFPEFRVAVELQGGVWTGGRHSRGAGIESDAEKATLAQLMGWLTIAVTPGQVSSGKAIEWITAALRSRGWEQAA